MAKTPKAGEIIPASEAKTVLQKGMAAAEAAAATAVKMGILPSPESMEEKIELYGNLVWAYAGIYAIASTAAKLEIKLWKRNRETGQTKEVKDHAVLRLLEHPNPRMSRFDLIESLFTYMESAGECYWEITTATVGRTSRPIGLYPIRPTRITPVPSDDGKTVDKFIFKLKGRAATIDFMPEQIVPFWYFNPMDDWRGQSSLQAAIEEIKLDREMTNWNLNFFKQGAVIEGIFTTESSLTVHEMNQIRRMIQEWISGQGRTYPILGKGLTFDKLSANPQEAEYLEGLVRTRRAILTALGVPEAMVMITGEIKFSNFMLQKQVFYDDTIAPKITKIEDRLNISLLKPHYKFADSDKWEYYLAFDRSSLNAEDPTLLSTRIRDEVASGLLTPNEGRVMLGRDEYDAGNIFVMSKNLIPVEQILAGGNGLATAGGDSSTFNKNDAILLQLEELQTGLGDVVREAVETEVERQLRERLTRSSRKLELE